MFQTKQRVVVSNPMNLQGPSPWKGRVGLVVKTEPGWVFVLLKGQESKPPIPFRERELSAA